MDCSVRFFFPFLLIYIILITYLLTGSKGSNRGQQNAPQPFRLHGQDSGQRAKERQPPFGPFPRSVFNLDQSSILFLLILVFGLASRRGLVEKSSLIRHASSAKTKRPDNTQPSQMGDRSANAIDSQTLLKDVKEYCQVELK